MKHEIHEVTAFTVVGPYVLRLVFEDRTSQPIDFRPVLKGEMFGPLRDLALFNAVRLDPECHTVVWPNGADFDPATLHDWPECAADFIAKSGTWEESVPARKDGAEGALRVAEAGTTHYASEPEQDLANGPRLDKPRK